MSKGEKGHWKKNQKDKSAEQRAKERLTKGKKDYSVKIKNK